MRNWKLVDNRHFELAGFSVSMDVGSYGRVTLSGSNAGSKADLKKDEFMS